MASHYQSSFFRAALEVFGKKQPAQDKPGQSSDCRCLTCFSDWIKPLLPYVTLALSTYWGMSIYEQAQIRNQQATIIASLLPHISPQAGFVPDAAGGNKQTRPQLEDADNAKEIKESERRYAALVALSQFQDKELLYRMAIQYPKEGLALAVDLSRGQLRNEVEERVIQEIIGQQETAIQLIDAQGSALDVFSKSSNFLEDDLHLAILAASSQLLSIATNQRVDITEEQYQNIHSELTGIGVSMVMLYSSMMGTSSQSEINVASVMCRSDVTEMASSLIDRIVNHDETKKRAIRCLHRIRIFARLSELPDDQRMGLGLQVPSCLRQFGTERVRLEIREIARLILVENANRIRSKLPDAPVTLLVCKFANAIEESTDESQLIREVLSLLLPTLDSPEIVLRPLLRVLKQNAERRINESQHHQTWLSEEMYSVQAIAKKRLKEIEKKIEEATLSSVPEIAVRIFVFYVGMNIYASEIQRNWSAAQGRFADFIKLAKDSKKDCDYLHELRSKLRDFVVAADRISSVESRRLAGISVALYHARVRLAQTNPIRPTCILNSRLAWGCVLLSLIGLLGWRICCVNRQTNETTAN